MSYVESSFSSHSTSHLTSDGKIEEISSTKHVLIHSNNQNQDNCTRCMQQIYPLEMMGQIMGLKYHKQCFKCSYCDRNLDFKNYKTNVIDLTDKQIYCSSHAPKNGKATIDFQAHDNAPRNIIQEYESQRRGSTGSVGSVESAKSSKSAASEKKATGIIISSVKKSKEDLSNSSSHVNDVIDSQRKASISSLKSDKSGRSESKATGVIINSVKSSEKLNDKVEIEVQVEIEHPSNDTHEDIVNEVQDEIKEEIKEEIKDELKEEILEELKKEVEEEIKYEKKINDVNNKLKSHSRALSDGLEEVQWKEIYHHDRGVYHKQQSSDSTFIRSSRENLDDSIKWKYLDFKAGHNRPHQSRNTPEIYRKQVYGPYDSAYNPTSYDYGKFTWKEIFENEKTPRAKKSSLDLLNKDELTWREIYENNYKLKKNSTENLDRTEVQHVIIEPPPVEKVIDSMSYDSSLVKEIPSKDKADSTVDMKSRMKSDSYVSTKETSTYHHQLSEQSTQKHISVLVPKIINNRDSAYDDSGSKSPQIQITKSFVNEDTEEQKQKVLDELVRHSKETAPKPPKEEVRKIIEPAIVIPSTPAVIEVVKPVVIKDTKIIGENKGYGVIKLTIHYDELRSRLSITCHQAQNLKNVEKNEKKNDLSDPYCRIYLVPDDKKSYKRKTKVVKNNLNPKWEETFDYKLTYEQSLTKDLIVSLKDDKKGLFSKQETRLLGEVRLRLADLEVKRPFTRWYFLQPIGAVSNLLIKSGINPYKN